MYSKDIKGLYNILASSYDDPGTSGSSISGMFSQIANENPFFTESKRTDVFLELVEYILKENMANLYGAFDKKNDKEVKWEGSTDEVINMLRNFIENLTPKKLQQAHIYFYEFEYCFLVWKIEWVELLKRFNLNKDY
ncbi:hypothetical protein [Marivirga arenosa]|uniref:Uncharacterized protein n=1 Tax=Marivirga arenosa TaxID=3059076 RepID=A0AA51X413_9BACT|nr:hypothetical protein [Marivirga sp. BKB1-2]WNB17093.1 hypothetical protein QYS47_32930 [Marivirga sp. BKB1-2]